MSSSSPSQLEALLAQLEAEVAKADGEALAISGVAERLQRLTRTASAMGRPRPPSDPVLANVQGLPRDFIQALEAEGGQYRGRPLPEVRELELTPPGIVSLVSDRTPESDWVGGSLMGFVGENTCCFHGEILHVDATDGRLYAQTTRELRSESEVLEADRWVFSPFDFSQAARDAAAAYLKRTARLAEALKGVVGTDAPDATGAALDKLPSDVWSLPWGHLWGPPGTGKTEAAARLIADALRADPTLRILAVAPTNRAADTLALRVARMLERENALEHRGLCRIYRGGIGVGPEVSREFPRLVLDPDLVEHAQARAEAEEKLRLAEALGAPSGELAQVRAEAVTARRELKDPTARIARGSQAGLVVLTVHRALKLVSELGGEEHFDKLVVDEAGMISRAAAALMVPLAKSVLWAGDPLQLGPISQAGAFAEGVQTGVRRWLRASPMSHLSDASRDALRPEVLLLRAQHRMHPEISRVVSHFAYEGMLEDAEGPTTREHRRVPSPFPDVRAGWVVLDRSLGDGHHVHAERGPRGRGYLREASGALALDLAAPAIQAGLRVLALTPYRAQAEWLKREAASRRLSPDAFTASTVHSQQGTEADLVLVDTVNAGRPFHASELTAMLNVAASRAREYLFVLSSRAEAHAQVPWRLLGKLQPLLVDAKGTSGLRAARIELPARQTPTRKAAPTSLSDEVASRGTTAPLPTREQVALIDRRVDEGHHVVRGVAGSGKTWVLVSWAARHLAEHQQARILITFFNRSLARLVRDMLREALTGRIAGGAIEPYLARAKIQHADRGLNGERFSAVFVDEAQDLEAEQLQLLYDAVDPVEVNGRQQRALHLFLDDSQNIYGRSALDDMREKLPAELSFAGRTRVLRESFRSPRQLLDLAFNTVLDPLALHGVPSPGMREFIRTRDLLEHGLLEEPGVDQPLFQVGYTEREGTVPLVKGFESFAQEVAWLAAEIRRLIAEGLAPGSLLVVSLKGTQAWAEALNAHGVRAVAYGGKQGAPPETFPPADANHVRVTTIMSAKGHESPVVFLVGTDALDEIDWMMRDRPRRDARETERTRRSLFYVGATRATLRQYVTGHQNGRFVRVAAGYAGRIAGTTITDHA